MAEKIVFSMGPPDGYHEAGNGAQLLVCDRCGSLVVEVAVHDHWHLQQAAALANLVAGLAEAGRLAP